jgi:hypothetical protein
MTHQKEIAQGYRGLLNWGQRVAGECGIVGTQSNFKVIEDTLSQQRERIAELEAQAAKEAQETVTMERALTERITELELETVELKRKIAIRETTINRVKKENENLTRHLEMRTNFLHHAEIKNAALVNQSTSGGGEVRMEYRWKQCGYSEGEIDRANKWAQAAGWELHHIEGVADNSGYVLIVWKRPVQQSKAIYPSDTLPDAWGMDED